MKRIFSFILIFGLLACFFVPAQAAGTLDCLTISGPKTCQPGSTITMAFGLKEGANVSAFEFFVSYDTDTFQYVDYENGELVGGAMAAGNEVNGEVKFTGATLTPINQTGVLFTVTFTVDSNAKGNHNFYYYSSLFSDEAGNDYTVNAVKQVVSVEGDVVSTVEVAPVYDANGNLVKARVGEMGVAKEVENNEKDLTWLMIVGIIFGLAGLIAGTVWLLIVLANRKEKKAKAEREAPMSFILDEQAKEFLEMEEDSLKKQEEREDKED